MGVRTKKESKREKNNKKKRSNARRWMKKRKGHKVEGIRVLPLLIT